MAAATWRLLRTEGWQFRFLNSCDRSAVAAETEQRGKAFPLCTPLAFLLRATARWLCFRQHSDSRKIPPLRGALRSGYNPRKLPRGFPPLLRRDFGTGLRFILHNLACFIFDFLKSHGRFRNLAERSGFETRGSNTERGHRNAARFPACRCGCWNIACERSAQFKTWRFQRGLVIALFGRFRRQLLSSHRT